MSPCVTIRKSILDGYPLMLVGYMRVSSDSDRQSTDLQRDALLAAGVDARHLFEDHASGAKDDRAGLAHALEFVRPGEGYAPIFRTVVKSVKSLPDVPASYVSCGDYESVRCNQKYLFWPQHDFDIACGTRARV